MVTFSRAAWTDHLPPQGFATQLRIEPPEMAPSVAFGSPRWTGADQKIMRVPYTIGNVKGVIDISPNDNKYKYPWPIHPDRGSMNQEMVATLFEKVVLASDVN